VGIVSYSWDWGNGKAKTVLTTTTTATFGSAGIYTITLTVTDGGGLTNTIVKQLPVGNQPPTATISAPANNASVTQGVAVTFTGAGSDPQNGALTGASLTWTSSINGQIGTGVSFSTTTLSAGTHVITLTATDAQGATDTDTRSITIVANQPPVATIATPANNALFSGSSSVSFNGTGSDPENGTLNGASLVWTSSINRQIGTGTSFTTSTLSGGTHTITLTARDALGAIGTATRTIIINRPPTASITAPANSASFTQGTGVALTGTGTDPEDGTLSDASLVWTSSRDGQIGTGASFSTLSLSLGTHVITLTAKDA
jgi:PKD repeat protein